MNYHRLKIVVFALLFGGTVFAASAENLLLAHTLPNGLPDGRRAPEGATVAVRDGKLNVDFTKPGSLQYSVYITPDHRRLLLSGELAGENLVPGQEGWQNGRIAHAFSRQRRETGRRLACRFRGFGKRHAEVQPRLQRSGGGGPASG